jgi:predicted component of type VI protein secretion system
MKKTTTNQMAKNNFVLDKGDGKTSLKANILEHEEWVIHPDNKVQWSFSWIRETEKHF